MLAYTVRPLSDRTWTTPTYSGTPYTATWTSTLGLLEREVNAVRGRNVVIEVDVPEKALRLDGLLRADARAASPAVRVAFDSKHGPLLMSADKYRGAGGATERKMDADWQHNVRAIALTLEALRAVERHGGADSGQQYTGWKALPSGSGAPASGMTTDEAWQIILRATNDYSDVPASANARRRVVRAAQAATHPDRHDGNTAQWALVDSAREALIRAGAVER